MATDEIVHAGRVELRPITMDDVTPVYVSWLNDPHVTAGLETVQQPYTAEMLRDFLQGVLSDANTRMFMVIDKLSGEPIGTLKIHNIKWNHGTFNLGMIIGNRNYWNKGFGSEALSTGITFAFEKLGLRKFCETVNLSNTGSMAMCRKLGFLEEGILREQVLSNGKYEDKMMFAVFSRDWKKK